MLVGSKGVGEVRRLALVLSTLTAWLAPLLGFAESPMSCPVHCVVYESYCLGPDDAIQSSAECPDFPTTEPGVEREVIACAFELQDSTLEGTCGWSRLGDYESADCDAHRSVPHGTPSCEVADLDGGLVDGVCEEICSGSNYDSPTETGGGCQAVGLPSVVWLFVSLAVLIRRRRDHAWTRP